MPRLGVKRNVIELGPPHFQPKQGAPYHPPSLPQLIFHFSSRAHRMRDVSISCQSFPGLCVTCVVISVWLTGSVVSHCPAPSDSHRLTLMMRRRGKRPRGVFRDSGNTRTVDAHVGYNNDKHTGCTQTYLYMYLSKGDLKKKRKCSVFIMTQSREERDDMHL